MSETKKSNREHGFDYELATIVGIEKAILLKNIAYWCEENQKFNREKYHENNLWWTEESLSSLAKKYPYMKRASIARWMQELFDSGWTRLQQKPGGKSSYSTGKVFELWNTGGDWKSELSQNETPKDRPKMRQSVSKNGTVTVPKWDSNRPKMRHNNSDLDIDLNGEVDIEIPAAVAPDSQSPKVKVEILPVEDGKNGTASRGPATQAKSWTHRAAQIFDEVAAEKCRENMVEYQPFNWSVCQEENFRQIKMLREKAIAPDFKNKFSADPTDEQMIASFRAVFRLAWDYFRKIQKEKGGALHYTPTSIYKSYNQIKTTATKNGNINGSPATGTTFGSGIDHNGTFDKTRGY